MKSSRSPIHQRRGFSLVELLTVLVIISIVSALAFEAMGSLGKSDGFNNATSTMSTLLEQARAYAMANNTYVFVGIVETDASQSAGGAQATGVGRVAMQAFAAQDGTMNFSATNLVAIDKLQILNNVDLPSALTVTSGTLPNRPTADHNIDDAALSVPSAITSRNFTFSKVIAFDSLGVVHIPTSPQITGFQYLEIDAQPTNGTVISSKANASAIQVDATTGAVTVYRS